MCRSVRPAHGKSHADQVGEAPRLHLGHDVRAIDLDGARADAELMCDDFVGVSGNEALKHLPGVSIIPLADGRGVLALEVGRTVADLEIAVIDRLDAPRVSPSEREALVELRTRQRDLFGGPRAGVAGWERLKQVARQRCVQDVNHFRLTA